MMKKKGHMGKTITFKSKEDRELFLSDYNSLSLTEKIFSKWMYQSKYDTNKIKFKENIIRNNKKNINLNLYRFKSLFRNFIFNICYIVLFIKID